MAILVKLTARRSEGSGSLVDKWGQVVSAPTGAVGAIGAVVLEHVAERFATKTDPWGAPWPPPSPVTLALRGGRTEINLGERRFSRLVSAKRVVVGLASAVARRRQFGAPRNKMFGGPPAPVPARAMLPVRADKRVDLPDALRERVMRAFREGIAQAVRSARSVE